MVIEKTTYWQFVISRQQTHAHIVKKTKVWKSRNVVNYTVSCTCRNGLGCYKCVLWCLWGFQCRTMFSEYVYVLFFVSIPYIESGKLFFSLMYISPVSSRLNSTLLLLNYLAIHFNCFMNQTHIVVCNIFLVSVLGYIKVSLCFKNRQFSVTCKYKHVLLVSLKS